MRGNAMALCGPPETVTAYQGASTVLTYFLHHRDFDGWSAISDWQVRAYRGQPAFQCGVEREDLVEMGQRDRPAGRGAVRDHRETPRLREIAVNGGEDLEPDRGQERHVPHVDDQCLRSLRDEFVGHLFKCRRGRQIYHPAHGEDRDVAMMLDGRAYRIGCGHRPSFVCAANTGERNPRYRMALTNHLFGPVGQTSLSTAKTWVGNARAGVGEQMSDSPNDPAGSGGQAGARIQRGPAAPAGPAPAPEPHGAARGMGPPDHRGRTAHRDVAGGDLLRGDRGVRQLRRGARDR